jgi:hypothetical protein
LYSTRRRLDDATSLPVPTTQTIAGTSALAFEISWY